jgi:hypothetical protein
MAVMGFTDLLEYSRGGYSDEHGVDVRKYS